MSPQTWPAGAVEMYDATLRDGMQGQGLSLTAAEKLRVALELDRLGVGVIEAGFPASNPKELEFFSLLERERLTTSTVAAFGMTRRRDVTADADPGLRVLVDSFARSRRSSGRPGPAPREGRARRSGGEPRDHRRLGGVPTGEGKRVTYDAEHFFDAYRDDPDYALQCLRAAVEAGAEVLSLCDTNGSSLPFQVAEATTAVVQALGGTRVAAHCHNDLECGVANSLAAVEAGATQVQGTMNGIGERTGNANLTSVIGALEVALDRRALPEGRLVKLTKVAHAIDELLKNRAPRSVAGLRRAQRVRAQGRLHIAAVRTDASTFEHVDPSLVGNSRELVISELAGRATVLDKAEEAGIALAPGQAESILEKVKEQEHRGYQYEAADASFELLLRRETGNYTTLCTLESWRVIVERRADGVLATEATVKLLSTASG